MKATAFSVMKTCSLVGMFGRFEGNFCLHLQDND